MPRLSFMTAQQVADFLTRAGVQTSARTLDAWRLKGTGPDYVRIEGRIRYRREAVRQWLEQAGQRNAGSAA